MNIQYNNQYGFGDFLQKNAGAIGMVAGGVGGAFLGNPMLGAQLGGMAGGAVQANYAADKAEDAQKQAMQVQQRMTAINAANTIPAIGNSFALGGDMMLSTHKGNTHETGGITLPGTNNEIEDKEAVGKTSDGRDYVFSNRLKPNGSKKTFAALADKIKSKYPRAKFDLIEKQDMQDEIDELTSQQETYKKENKIGEYSNQEFKYGGKMKYSGLDGTSTLNTDNMRSKFNSPLPDSFKSVEHAQRYFKTNPGDFSDDLIVGPKGYGKGDYRNFGPLSLAAYNKSKAANTAQPNQTQLSIDNTGIDDLQTTGIRETSLDIQNPIDNTTVGNSGSDTDFPVKQGSDEFNNPNADYGLIGLGASALGFGYLSSTADELPVNYQRVNPQEISLERERQTASREAGDTSNRIRSGLTALGTPSSSRLIAGQTEVQRNLGNQLSRSYQNEEQYNVGVKNRAEEVNARIQQSEVEARARESAAAQARKDAAIQTLLSGITQYGSGLAQGEFDIQKLKAAQQANYGAKQGAGGIETQYLGG